MEGNPTLMHRLHSRNSVVSLFQEVSSTTMTGSEMSWDHLLNPDRIRGLMGGRPSIRQDTERRDEFERDYGRVLYSTPIRRLKDKAQVFPLEPHDAVRTRLAHSLEVSSVARGLAAQVATYLTDKLQVLRVHQGRQIATIAATCGLLHDLGNPPFGHAGELAIQTWFKERLEKDRKFFQPLGGNETQQAKDFLHFEGNAQTLRLISHTTLLADPYGMDLTCGTFSAACKYLAASHTCNKDRHSSAKPGYFGSEQDVVDLVRNTTHTGARRNPITYLVEAADDIVYSAVDLEDGVKKGTLEWPVLEECLGKTELGRKALQGAHGITDQAAFHGRVQSEAMVQAYRTVVISLMVGCAFDTFLERYIMIMSGNYDGELVRDPVCKAAELVDVSKSLLKQMLYTDKAILKLEVMGRCVIHKLMDLFWEAAEKADGKEDTSTYRGKLYLLISENYRRVFKEQFAKSASDAQRMYCRLQLVTDHVAGMTDTYACRLHKELTNG